MGWQGRSTGLFVQISRAIGSNLQYLILSLVWCRLEEDSRWCRLERQDRLPKGVRFVILEQREAKARDPTPRHTDGQYTRHNRDRLDRRNRRAQQAYHS